jgi:hypothetical protein
MKQKQESYTENPPTRDQQTHPPDTHTHPPETSNENINDTKAEVRQPEVSSHAALIGGPRKEPAAHSEPTKETAREPTLADAQSNIKHHQISTGPQMETLNHKEAHTSTTPHQHGRDQSTEHKEEPNLRKPASISPNQEHNSAGHTAETDMLGGECESPLHTPLTATAKPAHPLHGT